MDKQQLNDIEAGLNRWHCVSVETARILLDEIYRLQHHIGMESMHTDIIYRERDDAYREIERLKESKNA